MKHTKSMTYKPTEESRELKLYADNTYSIYKQFKLACENLKKHITKGNYSKDKAVDLMYYVATAASDAYNKDFGYKFDVTARYTVAVELVEDFEAEQGA